MGGDKEDGAYAHEATFINAPLSISTRLAVVVDAPPTVRPCPLLFHRLLATIASVFPPSNRLAPMVAPAVVMRTVAPFVRSR